MTIPQPKSEPSPAISPSVVPRSRTRTAAVATITLLVLVVGASLLFPGFRAWLIGLSAASAAGSPHTEAASYRVEGDKITVSDEAAAAMSLKPILVEVGNAPVTLVLTGRTGVNLETVTHVHAQFPGRIVDVGPALGAIVNGPGEPGGPTRLCVIESTDLATAKGNYLQAKVQVDVDQDMLKRTEPLVKSGFLADKALLDAQNTLRKDVAAYEAAYQQLLVFGLTEADLAGIERQQGRERTVYEMLTPRSGMIIEKNVTRGELSDPTLNLFTIADLSTLWVWGDVYERDMAKVKVGQKMQVFVAAQPDKPRTCTIDWISPVLDPTTRAVRIRGRLDNLASPPLLADLYATLVITIDDGAQSMVLPAESVVQTPKGDFVFVKESVDKGNTTFKRRSVGTQTIDGARVRVLSGLKPGEAVLNRSALGCLSEVDLATEPAGG